MKYSLPLRHIDAVLRISLGWIFLWGFIDKLFGFGFATVKDAAWLAGGSPTTGFLTYGTKGPLSEMFQALAGQAWVDWLFMIGLLFIGLALIFGVGMRIATLTGSVLLAFMWLATLPPEHNPLMDEHLIYILVLQVLNLTRNEQSWSLGQRWSKVSLVKKFPILK
ncbi:MAG: DoxX family membrane protein [bacterium]|nr:DoxX family membrane protein [bacterium]